MKSNGSKLSTTFHEAIELGEYDPKDLSRYPEWRGLSSHAQFQKVRDALENRRHQLLTQYAEINNMLDFRLKPELQEALNKIKEKLDKIESDREDLYVKFASKTD
jgi:hypothetical protein